MTVEKVYVVEMHAAQRLVERCHEILARTPFAVRSGPHVVASLGGNEEFVAIRTEGVVHESSERLLGGTINGTVVVGEIEVRDTVVEGKAGDVAAALVGVYAAEIMPETETDLGEQDAGTPTTGVGHGVVA